MKDWGIFIGQKIDVQGDPWNTLQKLLNSSVLIHLILY